MQETEYQKVYFEAVSPKNSCINKTGKMAASMDILTTDQRTFCRLPALGKELQETSEAEFLGEVEISLSQGWSF